MKKIILSILILLSFQVQAQDEKFKALFMYKFAQNFEYPGGKLGDTYTIGVIGSEAMVSQLQTLTAGRKIGGLPIDVQSYTPGSSMRDIAMVFIAHRSRDLFESVSKQASNNSTVVVTETPGLGAKGSAMNFITNSGKLAFEMNVGSLDAANVKVSSTLRSLAILVD